MVPPRNPPVIWSRGAIYGHAVWNPSIMVQFRSAHAPAAHQEHSIQTYDAAAIKTLSYSSSFFKKK